MPVVRLHVETAERLDGQIHRATARLRGDLHLTDMRQVEAFPLSRRAAVRIHVTDARSRRQRPLERPHMIARMLVTIGAVVMHRDGVWREFSDARLVADD